MTRPAGGKPHYRLRVYQGPYCLLWCCWEWRDAPWQAGPICTSSAEAIRRAPR